MKKKNELEILILNDEYKVIVCWGDVKAVKQVLKDWHYPKTDVVCFNRDEDMPIDFELDVKTMIEKCVIAPLEHVLDAAGINIEDLLYGSSKLEEWF